jgi:hypothetical protein
MEGTMKSAREMVVEAIHKWYHSDKCHCCTDLADQILSALGQGECELQERIAQIIAHRACCGSEHNPAQGKFHGYCVVCGVPFPCEYVGKPLPQAKGETSKSSSMIEHATQETKKCKCGQLWTHHDNNLCKVTKEPPYCPHFNQVGCTHDCNECDFSKETPKRIEDVQSAVQKWLLDDYKRDTDKFWKYVSCVNHEFEKYGLGYKCKKCDFYTGTLTEINEIIKVLNGEDK